MCDPCCPRLRVVVEQGDFFMINTRIWWHQTRIPCTADSASGAAAATADPDAGVAVKTGPLPSKKELRRQNKEQKYEKGFTFTENKVNVFTDDDNELSISYARDFFAPLLRLPQRIAALADGTASENNSKNSSKKQKTESSTEETATTAADSSSTEFKNVEGLYASRPVAAGDVVLTEDELPECSLPRSEDPSCQVVWLEGGTGALVARRALVVGDWLSIAPSDDEESGSDDDDGEENDDDEEEEEEECEEGGSDFEDCEDEEDEEE